MNILTTALIIVALLLSAGLILVVVVQKSKGGGLASSFASANSIMGAPKSTDMLEKLTWWIFGLLATVCIVVSVLLSRGATTSESLQQTIEQRATQAPQQALPTLGGEGGVMPAPAETLDGALPAEAPASAETPAEAPATETPETPAE